MVLATERRLDPDLRHCIDLCQSCHATCVETINHCLHLGGAHGDPAHIRLLSDCADICRVTADFVLRASEYYNYPMGVCAFLCERCASECDVLGGDAFIGDCARACRSCHAECLRLSKGRRPQEE